jgi:hypothetical protein
VTQLAMVVRDSRASARRYWEDVGIGPWSFYTLTPSNTPRMMLRGRPVEHAFRVAITTVGSVDLELIEPLEGESLYAEHLRDRGEGLHHMAFEVEDFAAARIHLRDKGYAELQSGEPMGIAVYAYFDTQSTLGFVTELVTLKKEVKGLPPPEFTYP